MEIRVITWVEIESQFFGVINNKAEKWRLQFKTKGQWKDVPVVDAGIQKNDYNPEDFDMAAKNQDIDYQHINQQLVEALKLAIEAMERCEERPSDMQVIHICKSTLKQFEELQ